MITALCRRFGVDPEDVDEDCPLLWALVIRKSSLARRIRRAYIVASCRAYDRWQRLGLRLLKLRGIELGFWRREPDGSRTVIRPMTRRYGSEYFDSSTRMWRPLHERIP